MPNMESPRSPTGWLTGSSLGIQHRVPLPVVTDQGPKWGQTKIRRRGVTRNHVMGGGDSTWLISRTQVSRFSAPLPGDCCQGNRVRGKSGSQQHWGRPWLVWQHQPKAPRPAFISLWQSWFIRAESLLTFSHFPQLLHYYWPRFQALQARSQQLA